MAPDVLPAGAMAAPAALKINGDTNHLDHI
jgi:hypothetical protein